MVITSNITFKKNDNRKIINTFMTGKLSDDLR